MISLNQQIPEPAVDYDYLEINDVFLTIQGEGPLSGTRSVFVRMAGCNLKCPMCDTEYTKRTNYTVDELITKIEEVCSSAHDLVVITGGEPFRQYRINEFITKLQRLPFPIQIETNGTYNFDFQLDDFTTIVISPKRQYIHPDLKNRTGNIYYKYVLNHKHINPDNGLPTSILGKNIAPYIPELTLRTIINKKIYIQPEDSQDPEENKKNKQAVVESCLKFGYRASIQLHKELEIK